MICANCKNESTHIKYYPGIGERCPNCANISENRNTEDLITRNRVRMDSLKYEGDTLPPTKYDKSSKKFVPNEEFIKLNGVRAKNFLKKDELQKSGYNKLVGKIDKAVGEERALANQTKNEVEHIGSAKKRIKELLS